MIDTDTIASIVVKLRLGLGHCSLAVEGISCGVDSKHRSFILFVCMNPFQMVSFITLLALYLLNVCFGEPGWWCV